MKFLRCAGWVVVAALNSGAHAAETAYVIDKLLVGIHQDKDLNSAITKVLPTGTKLNVLQRDGELAQVKDGEGVSGWVDAAYLMKDPPASAMVTQLTEEKATLTNRLAELEAKTKAAAGARSSNGNSPEAVENDTLTKENTNLKAQLSAEKLKNAELDSQNKKLQASSRTPAAAAELQEANLSLQQKVEEAEQRIKELEAQADKQSGGVATVAARHGISTPILLVIGGLLIAAFAGGIYSMDYLQRRRHGGFRI